MTIQPSANKRILRLLIVDDSPDDADRLAQALRIARFMLKSQRVTDGTSLKKAIEEGKWDMVVSEYKLDNLSGRQALDIVKNTGTDMPFLIYANGVPDEDIVELMRAGARDVLIKVQDARLIPVIERELDSAQDRKEYRRANRMVKELEGKHQAMIQHADEAVCYSHDGMHLEANEAYISLFGYDKSKDLELIPILSLIAKEDQPKFKEFIKKINKGVDPKMSPEFTCVKKDGSQFNIEVDVAKVNHKGEDCLQLKFNDITKRKAAENRLLYLSQRDPLTGLYNRHHFTKLLTDALERTKKTKSESLIVYLDLYTLAEINNKLGYTAGDRALLRIGKQLQDELSSDNAIISRYGGDEFVMLLEGKDKPYGFRVVGKLKQMLKSSPLSEKGKVYPIECATSIVVMDHKTRNAQAALTVAQKAADADRPKPKVITAQPSAKPATVKTDTPTPKSQAPSAPPISTQVTGAPAHSSPAPAETTSSSSPANVSASTVNKWRDDIEHALEDNRFKLVYQPIISLQGSGSEYFEVLLRMVDLDGHTVMPNTFMPYAEKLGLSKAIDRWVTEHAIQALADLHSEGRLVSFFVNLSPQTPKDHAFASAVQEHLNRTKLSAQYLVFELDQSTLENDVENSNVLVGDLYDMGCTISIDNCGLDISTVLNLPRHSVKFIKIGGSTIRKAAARPEDVEKLNAMLEMAVKLDIRSVVKGVENASALSDIWTYGIEYVQGNYFQEADAALDYDFVGEDEATLASDEGTPSSWSR